MTDNKTNVTVIRFESTIPIATFTVPFGSEIAGDAAKAITASIETVERAFGEGPLSVTLGKNGLCVVLAKLAIRRSGGDSIRLRSLDNQTDVYATAVLTKTGRRIDLCQWNSSILFEAGELEQILRWATQKEPA